MRNSTFLLLLAIAACATDEGVTDELAGEDGDGVDDGKADDAGAFSYYRVTGNTQLSIALVNKAETKCADGAMRSMCRIGAIDYAGTGLTADEVAKATAGKALLVRGTFVASPGGDTVRATELWVGEPGTASGVFVKLRDADVKCTTLACESRDEIKLNSTRRAQVADLDFGSVDGTHAQAAIGPSGLIVAGDRFTAGSVRGRTVTRHFTRVTHGWNVHDVSILFPLPQAGEENLLLRVNEPSNVLLPEAAFKLLGDPTSGIPFLVEGPGREQMYAKLRVTSARIDPCFDGQAPCARQVRLVAQPIDAGNTFFDASVHLFFTLDDAAFVKLLATMRTVAVGSGFASLGVHPTMAREGLRGPTAKTILDALREACNPTRLTKFTVMVTGRSKNWFFFTLLPDANGVFHRERGENNESAFSDHGQPAQRDPSPLNDPAFPEELLSTASVKSLSQTALLAGIDKLERIANPKLAKTSETRCASCHAIGTTLQHALDLNGVELAPRMTNSFAPTPYLASRLGFGNHHAFSYLNDEPTVNRRAANDSIVTVRFLQSQAFLNSLTPEQRALIQ